mgnify:CR=1 FL=1
MKRESLKYIYKRISISEEMSHTEPKVSRLCKKNLRYMYKKKILINLLLIFLCSCSSNLNREIIRLDPTNEKYHTPGCREIRKKILDQKSDPSESVARGALSTYFLGAISLPALGFLEIKSEEYKKSLIAELKRNCY